MKTELKRRAIQQGDKYPAWICSPCGRKYGRWREGHVATFHEGDKCGWCGQEAVTTEPRDYGFPPFPPAST